MQKILSGVSTFSEWGLFPTSPQSEGFHLILKTLLSVMSGVPVLGIPNILVLFGCDNYNCTMALLICSLIPPKKNKPHNKILTELKPILCAGKVEENPGKWTSMAEVTGEKGSHRTQQVLSYSIVFIFLNNFALEMATTVQNSGPAF